MRFIVFLCLLHYCLSYSLYITFKYNFGEEYDIKSNSSFISVIGKYDTPLYYYLPPECDGKSVIAKKNSPYILLKYQCTKTSTPLYDQ